MWCPNILGDLNPVIQMTDFLKEIGVLTNVIQRPYSLQNVLPIITDPLKTWSKYLVV